MTVSSRSWTGSWRCPRAPGCWSWARSSRTARPRATGSSRPPAGRASCGCASTASSSTSTEAPTLDKYKRHTIEVVVDRLVVAPRRTTTASPFGPEHPEPGRRAPGRLGRDGASGWARGSWSSRPRDPGALRGAAVQRALQLPVSTAPPSTSWSRAASRSTRPTAPAPTCTGLGVRMEFDPARLIPDRSRSVAEGALAPWRDRAHASCRGGSRPRRRCSRRTAGTTATPIRDLPPEAARLPADAPQGRGEGRGPVPPRARRRTRYVATSRASSPTSSGATARRTRSTSRPSSRSTWSSGPARRAAASGSSRRSSASPSTAATSRTSPGSR